eukprot:NODE_1880_length_874_cov_234.149091_g1310_i0.p1 GENE.NODE_1880_length_874_cov_234.149091_g1310_i0~~NODE_1880_length_874_cov_234.149091_g1310_i0.p1  ORF type:complete len:132 (-),score=17.50 NODE_1880_length_874_cov_234.149091_g1310_i0:57-452(-)
MQREARQDLRTAPRLQAEKLIYICGWSVFTDISLLRERPINGHMLSIGDLLKKKAVAPPPDCRRYCCCWWCSCCGYWRRRRRHHHHHHSRTRQHNSPKPSATAPPDAPPSPLPLPSLCLRAAACTPVCRVF